MAKPLQYPLWNTSGTNRTEPPLAQKETGWEIGQIPPSSYENWRASKVNDWVQWFDEFTELNRTDIDTNTSDIASIQSQFDGSIGITYSLYMRFAQANSTANTVILFGDIIPVSLTVFSNRKRLIINPILDTFSGIRSIDSSTSYEGSIYITFCDVSGNYIEPPTVTGLNGKDGLNLVVPNWVVSNELGVNYPCQNLEYIQEAFGVGSSIRGFKLMATQFNIANDTIYVGGIGYNSNNISQIKIQKTISEYQV